MERDSERDPKILSDMLSSRSYLDLSHERPHTQKDKKLSPEPHQSERPRTPKHLPSRAPNTPDQVSGIFDNSSAAPDRPARKRGRPKLETIKDAAAIEVDPARSTCGCHRYSYVFWAVLTRSTGTSPSDSTRATHV